MSRQILRLIQAISQVSMPDNPLRGQLFHADYVKTRVVDLYRSLQTG